MPKNVTLSKQELADYQRLVAKHQPVQWVRALFVNYAKTQGGTTLDVWRLLRGPWFGEPQVMDVQAVARQLSLPVSDVIAVLHETHAALHEQVRAAQPALDRVREQVKHTHPTK